MTRLIIEFDNEEVLNLLLSLERLGLIKIVEKDEGGLSVKSTATD